MAVPMVVHNQAGAMVIIAGIDWRGLWLLDVDVRDKCGYETIHDIWVEHGP